MQPTSSSSTVVGSSSSASAEEREAAANNSPQWKRRQMATSHGVQQIPETSTVLISPQQQEQPTLPPVEQRLVAEHQSAATASFAGTELASTGCPNPAAAFAEVPAADEPLATQASPAAEEIPLEDIATNLLPSQQEERQTGTSQTAALATTVTQSLSSASALATISSPYASPTRSAGRSAAQIAPVTLDTDLDMAVVMALDAALEVAIEELEHFSVLGSAELYILEPLRDHMTYSQLRNVVTKIDLLSVDLETVLAWQQALENRRRDPLGLGLEE